MCSLLRSSHCRVAPWCPPGIQASEGRASDLTGRVNSVRLRLAGTLNRAEVDCRATAEEHGVGVECAVACPTGRLALVVDSNRLGERVALRQAEIAPSCLSCRWLMSASR